MNIQIVRVDLNTPYEKLSGLEQILPPERVERIRRFRFDADKIRSLTAGLMLRRAVEAYLSEKGCADSRTEYQIKTGAHGKPYLDGASDFHFSISHAGEFVALALDRNPVGVDIEKIRLREKVAKRFYSEREQAALRLAPEEKRAQLFTQIWTGKEAYLKYTGSGLVDQIASIEVTDPAYWQAQHVFFAGTTVGDGGYYLTVCSGERVSAPELFQ